MPHSPAIHHAIVAVDIADFTNPARSQLHQAAMHNGLYEVLRTAFDNAGVEWTSCDHEDRGDGALILVPSRFSKTLLVDRLPSLLVAGLARYNAVHAAEANIQLRMAVHSGEVSADPDGKVSVAVNETFRILDAADAKADLRGSRGILAIIASETIYRDVIKFDPATEPGKFRQIPVAVKHTKVTAWLRILGGSQEDSRVLPTFGDDALDELRQLLDGVVVAQAATLVARCTGPGVPPLRGEVSPWDAVHYLLDFNAGPAGLPPAMIFVELAAAQLDRAKAMSLREWNNEQARHLRLGSALDRLRVADTPSLDSSHRLHLMILIEHDGLDPDRYLVSHWRQDDPLEWPPARGETKTAVFRDLEWVVDELVIEAEVAWSNHQGKVALEFVLPRALLNLPVDRWRREHRSGDPRPLALDYPIVIRSLERMMSQHWHRVWRARWRTLQDDPANSRVYFVSQSDTEQPYRIDLALTDERVVSMVLSQAPNPEPGPNDELSAALRAGLPAILWSRDDRDRAAVHRLIAGFDDLSDLSEHAFQARRAAFGSENGANNLVVLWDDPGRLVHLDQGGTA